ncbi:SPOR domain-containing protein [Marinomonas flavescens]|uniref:SPOR domain-containing protein n=1 Tax=Marinomonas flavescens TaxID=2529379 RepID=UPI001054E019|nr:SPOR domain-containing protein [Marinomonas flavescens]
MLDKKMTYRLIGAGIMIVAAAIILPQILDGERPPELDIQVAVSKPPVFPDVKIAPAQSLDALPDSGKSDVAAISSDNTVAKSAQDISLVPATKNDNVAPAPAVKVAQKSVPKVKLKPAATPSGRWTVQIASFSKEDNAKRLVDKLKKANYSAYSVTTNSLFKVFVGPELDRDTSEKVQSNIQKKFSLKGIVVRFSEN